MRKQFWLGLACAIAAPLLGAGSCLNQTTSPSTTTAANEAVFVAAGALSAAEQVAQGYEALPSCSSTAGLKCPALSSDPAVVKQIKAYDNAAYTTITPLMTAAENGTLISTAESEAATAAVSQLTKYIASQGVK